MRRAGASAVGVVVVGTALVMAAFGTRPPAAKALSGSGGTTVRASVSASGGDPDGDSSRAVLSGDGHVVVFHSTATNLVPGDPGPGGFHVYWRDLVHRATRQVDVSATGGAPGGPGTLPAVSEDGRYVAFQSDASNLVAGVADGNHAGDVFRRDMVTGTTILVSVSATGGAADGFSTRPSISADGRYVAFNSTAGNLVANAPAPGAGTDVYVRDLATGTTVRVASAGGGSPDDVSLRPDISADGRYVAFVSDASNLVPGAPDANGQRDVYRFDRLTGTIRRVSVSTTGGDASGASTRPAIDDDGRYVVFQSTASNLVAGDSNHQTDVFRRDMVTGTTIRVSVGPTGTQLTGASTRGAINADGRYVAFASNDRNVVGGDHNGQRDVFIRDLATNTNTRASVAPDSSDGLGCTPTPPPPSVPVPLPTPGTANPFARPGSPDVSTRPSLSADGHTILFVSGFCNLIPADTNHADDVFIRTYPPGS